MSSLKKLTAVIQHTLVFLMYLPVRIFLRPRCETEKISLLANRQYALGTVVACNHLSSLDPLFIFALVPFSVRKKLFPLTILAKERFFDTWWKRAVMNLLGCVPVGDGKNGGGKSIRDVIRRIKNNETIFLFPEGKVCDDGFGNDLGAVDFFAKFCEFDLQPIRIHGIRRLGKDWPAILTGQRIFEIYAPALRQIRSKDTVGVMGIIKSVSRYKLNPHRN